MAATMFGHTGEKRTADLVAREVILLWPRGFDGPAEANGQLWPVFLIVVGDLSVSEASSARPLFDMLNQPRQADELAVLGARCRWSVLDQRNALLRLSIHGAVPVRFATHIVFPARKVLGVLDVVAGGATIGITTSRRAARLSGHSVEIRDALSEMVLLSCPESRDLGAVADLQWVGRALEVSGT